jgi:hypothetical protein
MLVLTCSDARETIRFWPTVAALIVGVWLIGRAVRDWIRWWRRGGGGRSR